MKVRDAATVMLLRDAPGLEVFMLRRNLQSDFVGGAHVFPGGAVDAVDHRAHLEPLCVGRTDADASRVLGIESGGLAFWVAAIRECFEEAGVLLARHATSGQFVDFADPEVERRFGGHRSAVEAGERSVVEVALEEGLVLDVERMHYFAHWITPKGAPRRYDTRFFVAEAPPGQTPLPDQRETIESLWVQPQAALDRCERGEMTLIFPTIRSLQALTRFTRAADVLDHARSVAEVPAVQPKIVGDGIGSGVRIVLPGDPEYDALPDPPEGSVTNLPAMVPSALPLPATGSEGRDA